MSSKVGKFIGVDSARAVKPSGKDLSVYAHCVVCQDDIQSLGGRPFADVRSNASAGDDYDFSVRCFSFSDRLAGSYPSDRSGSTDQDSEAAEKYRRLIGALAGEKRRFNQTLQPFPAITRRNNLVDIL